MRPMRLDASRLVVIWMIGLLAAFVVYAFFGVWQENRLPGQVGAALIVAVCLLLTLVRRRDR